MAKLGTFKVWRVEWPNGEGFYHGDIKRFTMKAYQWDASRTPMPGFDVPNPVEEWRFGFLSRNDLKRWWDHCVRQELWEKGCLLVVYKAKRVIRDNHQCAFHLPSAKLIRKTRPWAKGEKRAKVVGTRFA